MKSYVLHCKTTIGSCQNVCDSGSMLLLRPLHRLPLECSSQATLSHLEAHYSSWMVLSLHGWILEEHTVFQWCSWTKQNLGAEDKGQFKNLLSPKHDMKLFQSWVLTLTCSLCEKKNKTSNLSPSLPPFLHPSLFPSLLYLPPCFSSLSLSPLFSLIIQRSHITLV